MNASNGLRWVGFGLSLVLVSACAAPSSSSDAPDASADSAPSVATAASSSALSIIDAHPVLHAVLQDTVPLRKLGGSGFEPLPISMRAGGAWTPTGSSRLVVALPEGSDGATRLSLRDDEGAWIEIRGNDSSHVPATLEQRAVVFERASLDTDVVHVASQSMVEEFRVLRTERASRAFRWSLRLGPRVGSVSRRGDHFEILDRDGRVLFLGAPVFAVDAKGVRRLLDLRVDEAAGTTTLAASLDAAGLEYPIVVDPGWTSTTSMSTPRGSAWSGLLPSGKVIVAGGNIGGSLTSSAETWDPSTGNWTTVASMSQLHSTGSSLVFDGKFFVVAGSSSAAEAFDGTSWATTYLPVQKQYPLVVSMGSKLLAAGGKDGTGSADVTSAHVFNGTSWSAVASMSVPRTYGGIAWLASKGKAIVFGGVGGTPYTKASAEFYDPVANTWSPAAPAPYELYMVQSLTLPDGRVLVYEAYTGSAVTPLIYDPASNSWSSVGTHPDPGWQNATVLTTGKVLLTGTGPVDPVAVFDPATNTTVGASQLSGRCSEYALVGVAGGKALAAGGFSCAGALALSTAEVFMQQANGQTCGAHGDCTGKLCVDGYCCNSTCTSICQACDVSGSLGTCSNVTGVPHSTRGDCGTYVCQGGGATCPTTCSSDSGCASGYYCSGTSCVLKKDNGASCPTGGRECATGNCVDGVCCNTACSLGCQACDAAGYVGTCSNVTGTPRSPRTCGSYLCVSGSSCPSSCTTDGQCVSGYYCNGTNCVAKKSNGTACPTGSHECTSTNCVDGYCCNSGCTSTCQACDVSSAFGACTTVSGVPHGTRGTCGAYSCQGASASCPSSCSDDGGCASGYYCSGTTCVAKKSNGASCPSGAHECSTGNCVDGVCCDTACGGQCEACDVGASLGTCVAVSGAPHGTRTVCSGTGVCQAQCSGLDRNACGAFPGTGIVCAAASCAGSASTPTRTCDGLGACAPGSSTSCDPYVCGPTSCKTSCSTGADCKSGYFCSGTTCVTTGGAGTVCSSPSQCASGNCVDGVCCTATSCTAPLKCNAKGDGTCSKPLGTACSAGSECGSGQCVDGVCCNVACGGQCEACDVGGSVGTCVPAAGAPHGSRAACGGTGPCKAVCNGSDRTTCGAYPGTSTVCAAASCSTGTATPTRTCDGLGNCAAVSTSSCNPYVCGPTSCKSSCGADTDCVAGYFCSGTTCVLKQLAGTTCTLPNQCQAGNCVDGVCCTTSSCSAGLRCNVKGDGTCSKPLGTTCSSSTECGSGLCVDGVCCNSTCTGKCEACDVGGSLGTCLAVSGAPHGSRGGCTGTGACQATCTGSDRTACGAPPGTGTVCAAASCATGTSTPTRTCDGLGSCALASTSKCDPYVCGGTACKVSCSGDTDCATGYFCSGSVCTTTGNPGTLCSSPTQCKSGNCVDGVCCTVSSCAAPLKCNAKGDGTCSKPLAALCGSNGECGSGFCADGVCCNAACSGQCEACDVGGSVGTCVATVGTPHGSRAVCGGTGACQSSCNGSDRTKCGSFPGTSTPCQAANCTLGKAYGTGYCDGLGGCPTPSPTDCGAYTCGTVSCKTSCGTTADCATGYACKSGACVSTSELGTLCDNDSQCKSGHCTAAGPDKKVCCKDAVCAAGSACADTTAVALAGSCLKLAGQTCSTTDDCLSGFCVDGVCCDSVCAGQCEACDVPGALGKCTAINGAPHGTRTKCSEGGSDLCKALACDGGKDRTKCTGYANGPDKECAPASCVDDTATEASYCDGSGTCRKTTGKSCTPYRCGDKVCRTSCGSDADCVTGNVCDSGKCLVAKAKCSDDGLSSIPADKSAARACGVYRCNPAIGDCFTTCTASDQCASPSVCDGAHCVSAPSDGTEDGGGCGLSSNGRSGGSAFVILALVAALARLRRRNDVAR